MLPDEQQHIFLNHVPLLLLTHDGNWIPSCIVESIVQDFDVSFKQGTHTISPERLAEICPDSFVTEIPSENKVFRWHRIPCKDYKASYYGEDITQERHWKKRAAETRLLHPLTRLPNLTYTLKKLAAWNREDEICAIRIGLVNLAVLNELYSEQCGNEAIRKIATTLNIKTCRPELFLGQLSGNQFLIAGSLTEPEAFVNELYHQLTDSTQFRCTSSDRADGRSAWSRCGGRRRRGSGTERNSDATGLHGTSGLFLWEAHAR
ncbi:Diguanylate cyclase, GGDEF domain [Sulfurivirga caldicuralii]|uniref:Diguanylate cyclase, GGDEF domain n=1 Tax=Sulfurivirga caldicuralii TaxID=364032 RepID=A0A1N6DQW8_9GAMM|nr:Diguanylate cyclase, GGDEF domain [Sulfurivirga caldicuralii]